MSTGEISHLVGPPLWIGSRLRQRCLWCGAVIIDQDLGSVAVAIPNGKTVEQAQADGDLEYPTWEVGAWIVVDGGVRYVARSRADDEAADSTPENGCTRLDPDATA